MALMIPNIDMYSKIGLIGIGSCFFASDLACVSVLSALPIFALKRPTFLRKSCGGGVNVFEPLPLLPMLTEEFHCTR